MATKTKTDTERFQNWKVISVSKIYEKVTKLKQKVKPRGAKLVLNDPMLKHIWRNYIVDFFLSPLTKHLISLLSFVNNST